MNKAKAIFTAAVIAVVAGASVVCWYLNEEGIIGNSEDISGQDSYISADGDYADSHDDYYEYDDNEKTENTTEKNAQDSDVEADEDVGNEQKNDNVQTDNGSNTQLNEFLSTFTKLYFSESRAYKEKSPDSYELLKFAFLYEKVFNDSENIQTKYSDDEIGVYSGIKASAAEDILDEFFGITVELNSVYTENTYSFFKYEDGYFYTPAADGIGYMNLAVADSVVKDGSIISVEFTVYSDGVSCDMSSSQARANGEKYASGRAELREVSGGYHLIYYSLNK